MRLQRQRVVVPDGLGTLSVPALTFEWAWASDVDLLFQLVHSDGTPYDLSGAVSLTMSFKVRSSDAFPILARPMIVTDDAAGEFEIHIRRGDRALLEIGRFVVGMSFEDDDTGFADAVITESTLTVTDPIASVTDPITTLPIDLPLARGPQGITGDTGATGATGAGFVFWTPAKSWTTVYAEITAAISSADGGVVTVILVDDAAGTAKTITAGTYDLTRVEWVGMSVNTSAFPFINATVNVEAGTTFDAGGVLAIRARDVAFQFAGGPIAAPGAHVQLNLNDTSLIRLGDFSLATGVVALIVKMMRQSGLGNVDVVTLPMFAMASNSQLAFDSFNGSFFDVKTFGGDVTVSTFGVADSTTTANIADPGVCSGAMSLLTFSIYGSQVQLPVFTDSTRPDPAALPAGALIYNSDDNDYNVTDGAGNWRRNGSVT